MGHLYALLVFIYMCLRVCLFIFNIINTFSQHRYQVFFNTINPSIERLCIAVALLDWSTGLSCSTILAKHRIAIDKTIADKQLEVVSDNITDVHYLPSEKAAQLQIECVFQKKNNVNH